MSGLQNLVKFDGEFVSVGGSGTATTTRSISKETENSITDTFTYDIDITSGAEVGGSGGSIGGGFGQSNSSVQVTTTGVTREVEVANVPKEGQGLYGFQWNMAIWDTKVGNQTVPVVGYVTRGVKQPPALPGAFTVTETTTDSVTLGWEESGSASSYEVYQYFKNSSINQYVKVAALDGDKTQYTVSGLRSGGAYEYVICSLDAKGERSVYSAPVTAVTLPEDGQSPSILKPPADARVRPGADAVFQVSAYPAAGAFGLTYAWYESAKGGSVWKQVGGSSSTLTLPQVTAKMDGNRYRCVVFQVIGGQQVLVYSDVATLHVGQGATATALTMTRNSGKAGYSVETTKQESVDVPKAREITVDGNTASYVEYNAAGSVPAVEKIYRANDGAYYVLEGLDETESAATKAVPLRRKPSEFKAADASVIPEGVTPDSLTGSEQGMFTIPQGSAASGTTAGDYYVYTAEIAETEGATAVRTVYALKSETTPSTYYTLSQEIKGEGDAAKTIYTMTAVAQTVSNVQPVMVAGTLIVKGENGVGEIVNSIPENDTTNTYTTYEAYNGNTSGDKVYRADGAYYLLTFDTTDANKVTARSLLTVVSYDTLEGEGYENIAPGEAVVETVTKDVVVLESKSGDSVTLTASVEETAGSAKPAGTMTFRIANADTGVSKNQTVTLSGDKAVFIWTPDAPGVYSVTASYNGNSSFLTSVSSPSAYYAIADGGEEFASLVLRPDATSVEYGDIVNLKLYEAKTENGVVTEKESAAANVKYAVRWENPAFNPQQPEGDGNKKYLEEEISAAWKANKVPGSYVFIATTQDGKSASAAAAVTRRTLELAAEDKEVSMGTVPTAGDLVFRRAGGKAGGAWADGENYASLFTVSTALTASSGSGVYQVAPVMVGSPNGADLAAFNSRYAWTPVNGQWTVQANTHTVTLTAGANGRAVGHVGESYTALTGTVKHGEMLSFTAIPTSGFRVSAWTMNGQVVTANTQGVALSEDLTRLTVASLTQDLNVNVTFSNQSYAVTFRTDSSGGGDVTAKSGGKEISPGGRVVGGASVTFIAAPDQGKIVKSWTVNGTTQKNEDGSNFVGNELTLDNISEDISVVAAFEDEVSYTVAFSAVNTKGEPAQSGAATLNSEGLDGNNQAVKGSKVVLKAAPGPGSAILEWQESKDNGKTWITLAGSQGSFTISNLQSDRNIRVQVNESVTTHKLTFGAVDMDGVVVAEAGTLTASIGGESVAADSDCLTSSKVDFSFQPAQAYEVAEWRVNGVSVQEGRDKLTYTIDSLLGNAAVQVAVRKKPQVTVLNTEAAKGDVTVEGFVEGEKKEIASGGYVDYGTDLTVTLQPKMGYEVANGDSMTAVANSDDRYYIISHAAGDQTVAPVWTEIPQVPLTFSVVDKHPDDEGGTDGVITAVVTRKGLPDYAQSVETSGAEAQTIYAYRDSVVAFISKPDPGYTIGTRKLDGNVQREQIRLNITAEHERHTVEIQFDPVGNVITYGFDRGDTTELAKISAKFTAQGSINEGDFASGNFAAADGSITFTVSDLNPEYQIEGWYVNGVKQEETGSTYAMEVKENVGAIVRVKLAPVQYTVAFSSDQGSVTAKAVEFESDAGEIAIGSGRALNSGSKVVFTAPNVNGYNFTGWTVNGNASDETGQTLTIDPLRQDTVVKANYEMIIVNYAVTYGVQGGNGTLAAAAGGQSLEASPVQVRSGSRVVFTAAPASGYQVKGWYSDENCTRPIAGTQAEQETYIISDLTGDVSVYVAFEPAPAYEITVDIIGTKQGTVTAAVNGQAADLSGGKLTVSRHDNVTLAATPNENQRLVAWILDGTSKGNSSMALNLTDVTAAHAVEAEFGSTQSVFLTVNVSGGNGSVAAQLGYGDDLQTVDAANGYRADVGQTVKATANPAPGYMVKSWTVNGVEQDNLSNALTIDSLTKTTVITVEYEPLALYSIPASDAAKGYTVTDVTKTPTDYGDASQIRGRGVVSFKVTPAQGQYLTELKIGGMDCLPDGESGDVINTPSGDATVQNNNDGSYAVTVKNVKADIALTATSMQFQTVQEELTEVPAELDGTFPTLDDLQNALRAEVQKVNSNVPNDQTALLDIKLQYTEDGGHTWQDATADNFPIGGIQVNLSYDDLGGGIDQSYDFTVIHMFATDMNGNKAGDTETIEPTKDGNGLRFTVTSLSPFAVGWTKPAPPAERYPVVIEESQHGKTTASPAKAEAGSAVTLTVEPDSGYMLDTLTAVDSQGNEIELTAQSDGKYVFTMPDSQVTVKAAFIGIQKPGGGGGGGGGAVAVYPVVIEESQHGKTTASPARAGAGSAVTLTVEPDSGYMLDTLTAVDSQGNEIKLTARSDGKYVFTMPGRAVTVKAAFAPLPGDGAKPCDGGADCPSHGFADLDVKAWYHDAVDYALKKGLMSGCGNGRFGPEDSLTRAQLAQILYNREGKPAVADGGRFTDVASGQWYTEAILWASQKGVVNGYGDGTFGPNDNITREQLAVMLWRYAKSPAAGKELDFNDADEISSYALDAVRWAAERGVLNGFGDGRLAPKGLATRAQAAQMLKNLIENQESSAENK